MATEVPMPEMSDGRPRHAPLRASLHQATVQDAELQAPARPTKAEDGRQATEPLRAIVDVAAPSIAHMTGWGHSDASFWLQNAEAGKEAFEYTGNSPSGLPCFAELTFRFRESLDKKGFASREHSAHGLAAGLKTWINQPRLRSRQISRSSIRRRIVDPPGRGAAPRSFRSAFDSSPERRSQPPIQPTLAGVQKSRLAHQDAWGPDSS